MDVLLPELFVGQLRAARLSPCEDIFVAVLAKNADEHPAAAVCSEPDAGHALHASPRPLNRR